MTLSASIDPKSGIIDIRDPDLGKAFTFHVHSIESLLVTEDGTTITLHTGSEFTWPINLYEELREYMRQYNSCEGLADVVSADPDIPVFSVNGKTDYGPIDVLDMLGRLQELRDSLHANKHPMHVLLITNTISLVWHMANHIWKEEWQEIIAK